jgi:hypothetical protein
MNYTDMDMDMDLVSGDLDDLLADIAQSIMGNEGRNVVITIEVDEEETITYALGPDMMKMLDVQGVTCH